MSGNPDDIGPLDPLPLAAEPLKKSPRYPITVAPYKDHWIASCRGGTITGSSAAEALRLLEEYLAMSTPEKLKYCWEQLSQEERKLFIESRAAEIEAMRAKKGTP